MILKLLFKNLFHKPWTTVLSLLLLFFGIGLISFILLLQYQLEEKFSKDMEGIDLVVGAKGSPLQLVLSAIYQVDAPTGNIALEEVEQLKKNQLVAKAIPLAYGDTYQSFRIVGTTQDYVSLNGGVLAQGEYFRQDMDAVVGSETAKQTGLKIGDRFYGTHGLSAGGHEHKEFSYVVKGILSPTGRVIDHLILTNIPTVWKIHQHEAHDSGVQEEHGHGEHLHDDLDAQHGPDEHPKEITALLVKLRTPLGAVTLPRMISENTAMQAAVPNLEVSKLFQVFGIGITTIKGIAIGIMALSAISAFISLYGRLSDRMYELAIARTLGASRWKLASLILTEGLTLVLLGYVGGLLLSRLALYLLLHFAQTAIHLPQVGFIWLSADLWLLSASIAIGILTSFIPAIKAYSIDISRTLSHE